MVYNPGHNFLELYNILVQIRFAIIKGNLISNIANLVYELPHELPDDLRLITSSSPLQLVDIDFVHLDLCSGGYENLSVITDHFTRFMQVYPTTNKSARTAAEKLYNNFMMRYGIPEKLLSDRGREFENELFHRLSKLCGIKKTRTTPYHPQTNGQVERMNQTVINILKCLPDQYKSNWRNHVNKLVHAYSSIKSSATGDSPYYLLFGRHPRLPIDVLLLSQSSHTSSYPEYAKKWEDQMRQVYQFTMNSVARKKKNINRYNTKVKSLNILKPGDRVLVRSLSQRGGTRKLRNHWQEKIHKIVSATGDDSGTYKIVPENFMKPKDRIVLRNMLLKCDDLLDHFSWNLGETKATENTKATSDKVGNSHNKSINNGLTARWSKTKKATGTATETSGDTESENEIEHL